MSIKDGSPPVIFNPSSITITLPDEPGSLYMVIPSGDKAWDDLSNLVYCINTEAINRVLIPVHPWVGDLVRTAQMLDGKIPIPHDINKCKTCKEAKIMTRYYKAPKKKNRGNRGTPTAIR